MNEPFDFGRYRVVSELGKGSTGTVYLAEGGGERVALKILHRSLASDPVLRRRFRREAALARELRHPGIVRVYDLVEHEGREALSMEYCPGGSLARLLAGPSETASHEPSLSASQAADWLKQLAEALGYAHGRGWVHRALKPENVLVGADGRLRLSDFGSARLENLSGLTTSTTYLATPLYIAPEVMRGEPVRPAHDLYSLGAVFYRLLSGRPHRSGGLAALLAPEGEGYAALSTLRPDLPERLSSLVDALLAPAAERPGSAGLVIDLLDGEARATRAPGKRCLYCDAPMPADAPFCPACRRPDLFPEEYRGDDAEALVLTKLGEGAETMDRLYRFLGAWNGDEVRRYRFITEDKRLYGKEEVKDYLQLPYPLLNWLSPEMNVRLIGILEIRGSGGLHLERRKAGKIQKKADKKPPILRAERPGRYRPIGSELLAQRYGELVLVPEAPPALLGAPVVAPLSTTSDDSLGGSATLEAVVFDCQRLADLARPFRPDAQARLGRLASRCAAMAGDLARSAAALDAVSLPELYAEETRLRYELADEAAMPSSEWDDARRRLERNDEAWRRYEELEAACARGAHRLEELRRSLSQVLRELRLSFEANDPVAQSQALAAYDELVAGDA